VIVVAVAVLLSYTVLSLAWIAWPVDGGYRPRHLEGRNPYADDLERALSATRRSLSHPSPWSPAPWHPATKRHSDETPRRAT
jgi:hypothetical protein